MRPFSNVLSNEVVGKVGGSRTVTLSKMVEGRLRVRGDGHVERRQSCWLCG